MSKTPPITQSLMKAMNDYILDKECGLRIEAFYYIGIQSEPSEAMNVGMYFEYRAFGTLPKSGKAPKPKVKGDKELHKKYQIAEDQAINIKRAIDHYGFKVISKGRKISTVLEDGTVAEGTMDLELQTTKPVDIFSHETGQIVEVIPEGTIVTSDAKTSGLMGERGKWNELGWHIDFLDQKERIMVQAVHYSYIQMKNRGKEVPFMFWVYSQTNTTNAMIVRVNIDPDRYIVHEESIMATRKLLEINAKKGWKPKPDLERCAQCELSGKCKFKIDIPKILSIYY